MDPREATGAAAEGVEEAQQDAVDARQELAEAEAELAALLAPTDGVSPSAPPAPIASPTPLVPEQTVARVQQAETELATAQAGISDATPLHDASEQFNAAAVALEVAWLQLFAQAGCLTDDQLEQATTGVRDYTVSLQQALTDAGHFDGEVDGVYGPETVAAVEQLQDVNGLPVTGTVDKATFAALQAAVAEQSETATQASVASTAALQQTLKLVG